MVHLALAVGISRGFLAASAITALALVIVLATIRIRRSDLTGAVSAPVPARELSRAPVHAELAEVAVTE
jgi:hypothetical protein